MGTDCADWRRGGVPPRIRPASSDDEFTHVEVAAAYLLSLAGVAWIADSLGSASGQASGYVLAAIALHSFGAVYLLAERAFIASRKLAIMALGCALGAVLASEAIFSATAFRVLRGRVDFAELLTIGVALWVWWTNRRPGEALSYPTLLGVAAYVAILLIDARVLGRDLVTARDRELCDCGNCHVDFRA